MPNDNRYKDDEKAVVEEWKIRIDKNIENSIKNYAEKAGTADNTLSSEAKNSTNGTGVCIPLKESVPISTKYSNHSSYKKISAGNIDKRVSLTVSPKTSSRDETLFVNKVKHVLGPKFYDKNNVKWLTESKFYGLLRNALGSTSGLIFPYTPKIQFNHKVNYESTDIIHSNLTYNYYKNTQPPTLILNAKFSADNRDNALHMLSAIWFLIACTKCEFGENTSSPGLPPPILYLSGYDHLIDNIPVIITSVSYTYPDNLNYVNLVLDMSKDYNKNEDFCRIYDTVNTNDVTRKIFDNKTNNYKITQTTESSKTGINMSYWLPTELDIGINLSIQPNLLKTKKQWSLDGYKTSLLMTNNSKNPPANIIFYEKDINVPGELYTSSTAQEPLSASCVVPSKEQIKETIEFIPSGWTW